MIIQKTKEHNRVENVIRMLRQDVHMHIFKKDQLQVLPNEVVIPTNNESIIWRIDNNSLYRKTGKQKKLVLENVKNITFEKYIDRVEIAIITVLRKYFNTIYFMNGILV